MTLRHLLYFCFASALLLISCKKKDRSDGNCDGIINESSPVNVYLKISDKNTGENLLDNGRVKETDISVVDASTKADPHNWRVLTTGSGASPYHGALQFSLLASTEGQHSILIKLGAEGNATLQYSVDKKRSEDPCRLHSYSVSSIIITDHPFTLYKDGEREIPTFLMIKL